MRAGRLLGVGLSGLIGVVGLAKNKPVVPSYVLRARTVAVMVDPNASITLEDPNANQRAQKDVESAILNWGRFSTVMGPEQADIVIVLKKGHGKMVEDTISDPRQNTPRGRDQSDGGRDLAWGAAWTAAVARKRQRG